MKTISFYLITLCLALVPIGMTLAFTYPGETLIHHSSWVSRYGKCDHSWVMEDVLIRFEQDSGIYLVHGHPGRLTPVALYPDEVPGHTQRIRGNWEFEGKTGWFTWEIRENQREFSGVWGYTTGKDPVGFWTGVLQQESN